MTKVELRYATCFSPAGPSSGLYSRQAMYVSRNTEERFCNNCCSGKAISITYSACVFVAAGVQHAMRMCCVVLSSVVCPAISYFST